MITPESITTGLTGFYIVGAIMMLALALVAFPTLLSRAREGK